MPVFVPFWLLLLPVSIPAYAQSAPPEAASDAPTASGDDIVVTANRIETPESEVASSTTVIGPDEIRRKSRDQVSDLLRDVPGLAVESQGDPGQTTSVFIRGTDSDHVLVLIDGVEANDPISPSRAFDFGNLSTSGIERIEIVRGSQSVLYGSEAIGGVINIITKKGRPGPLELEGEAEYGTYDTYRLSASARGGRVLGTADASGASASAADAGEGGARYPRMDYAVSVSQQGTQGFPAADQALGNRLDTGQSQLTLSGSGGYQPDGGMRLDAMIRYSNASFGLVGGGGPPGLDSDGDRIGDDPGSQGSDREIYGKLEAVRKLSEIWQAVLALHYTGDHRTSYINDVGTYVIGGVPTTLYGEQDEFTSTRLRGVFQNTIYLSDADTIVAGLELASESGDSTEIASAGAPDTGLKGQSDRLEAAFIQDQWLSDVFFATAGLRYDTYQNVGGDTTYRIAPGVKIPATATTLRGSVGTGFKVPSLYQRYSSFGDSHLMPERSLSCDAGFEQPLGSPRLVLAMTYFNTHFDQLIDFDFTTNHYDNVGSASAQGVESSLKWAAAGGSLVQIAYTYTLAKDDVTGAPLLHRPKHVLSAEGDYSVSDRVQVGALARFEGVRADTDPVTFAPSQLGSYAVFSLNARLRIAGGLSVFGRIDNLLDRSYEEVDGYGTAGRSVFLGVREEI